MPFTQTKSSAKTEKLRQQSLISKEIFKSVPDPLFLSDLSEENLEAFKRMAKYTRVNLEGQVSAVLALVKALLKYDAGILLGEPGVGKTQISNSVMAELLFMLENLGKKSTRKVAFQTTAKLIRKMARESKEIHGDKVETFEISSKNRYEIDPKTQLPVEFKSFRKKKVIVSTWKQESDVPTVFDEDGTKVHFWENGKEIKVLSLLERTKLKLQEDVNYSIPKEDKIFIPTSMVAKTYKIDDEHNGQLHQIFPEDLIEATVPENKTFICFISKDSAKMKLADEHVYHWGDRCDQCSAFLFPKNFKVKYKIQEDSNSWKKLGLKLPKGRPDECVECGNSCKTKIAKNIIEDDIFTIKSKKDVPDYKKSKRKLLREKDSLIESKKKRIRKLSVGEKLSTYSKKFNKKIFELYIVDEVHENQEVDSSQSELYREIISASKKTLIMTGTLSNGKASSVFYILQSVIGKYLRNKGYSFTKKEAFVSRFGSMKSSKTTFTASGRAKTTMFELPEINDALISILAPFTFWLKLEDMNLAMPSYSEFARTCELDEDVKKRFENFKNEVLPDLKKYAGRKIKAFAQRFDYLQNNPTLDYTYSFTANVDHVDEDGEINTVKTDFSYQFEGFPSDRLFKKEAMLVEQLKSEIAAGRNTMVYSIFNNSGKISERLEEVLRRELPLISIKRMPESIGGDKIEPWIEANPCQILIVSPLKVNTGLDLVQFPTTIFYEFGTNLRLVQQASRRAYRAIGQKHDVKIYFYAYNGLQARLLDLLGKKLKGAATIEGSAVETGSLASAFDDTPDFTSVMNGIANNFAGDEDFKFEYSGNNIEAGCLRPTTVFEQKYLDIVKEYKDSIETVDSENDTDTEVDYEFAELLSSEDYVSFKYDLTKIKIDFYVPEDAQKTTISPKKRKTRKKKVSVGTQLTFDF